MKSKLFILVGLLGFAVSTNANLIRNPSFEMVPGSVVGQGIMPSEWEIAQVTPDTYSNDGSYGLSPSALGNFMGVTAFDGIRWVAAWSTADERFGQLLTTHLVGGDSYTFSSYLIQAKRSDLDHFGGYELFLTSDSSGNTATGSLLGSIGPTTDSDDWEFFSMTFTAPANADALPFLLFKPFDTVAGGAYPGLDSVSLTGTGVSVPEPSTYLLTLAGLLSFLLYRRQRRKVPV